MKQQGKKCIVAALALFAAVAASATEFYYKGDLPGGITNCQNYCKRTNLSPSERYDRLPGADDEIVIVSTDTTIDIDDGHFDFLKTIKGINFKQSVNFRCNLCIQNDQTLPCWIADYSGYGSWETGRLVKSGPGDLYYCTNLTSTTVGGMRTSFDVREGDLWIRRPFPTCTSIGIQHVSVAAGCTIHAPTGTLVSVVSLSGAGDFTNDGTLPNGSNNDFYIGGYEDETEPTVFSGRLRGRWGIAYLNGYTYFTGTESDFDAVTRGYSSISTRLSDVRAVGFVSYPASGNSSLGTASEINNLGGPLRLRYLGTAATTAGRRISINDTRVGAMTIDGGAWGGLNWVANFDLYKTGSNIGLQQRIAFVGTNAGERCTFSGYFNRRSVDGTNYSYHVTKDGVGTWRFLKHSSSPWTGALSVRNGTLEFDTIAEEGKLCALGYATELYDDICDYTPDMTPVAWAWRLGDAADSSVTGTLQYVGAKDMHLETRKTALAGAGRFRFGEGSLFKYSAGIGGLGTGEKSMSFESLTGATNVIVNVSDGEAGAKVSVVKEGAGMTVLTGNLGFSGDVRAEAGELVLKDVNGAEYRYYRINFKENVSTSTHAGLEEYRTAHPTKCAAFEVGALGLYNSSGNPVFSNKCPVSNDVSYLSLRPNFAQMENDENMNYSSNRGYTGNASRLFSDGDQTMGAGVHFSPTCKDSSNYPTIGDSASWYRVHVRLPETTAAPVSWDLVYINATNSDNYAKNPTALSIDASADGATWEEVASTNDIVHLHDDMYSWLSNPASGAWGSSAYAPAYPERHSHPNKFPLAATCHQLTYARPTPRSVFVRKGATLRNESATRISVSALALDKGGMGTLDGFSLAAAGTLSVEGLSKESVVTISADFSETPGYENLRNWQLNVNGSPSTHYVISGVTDKGITLTKRGLMLIVR